jgi:tape measure domain-containing protein
MENNNLQIVFRIKDETTAGIESAKKNITGLQKTVQDSFSFINDHLKEGALAASGFLASVGLMAKGMIDVTSNMEQWRIAFETMLGSSDLAGKKLKELSDFAIKTPFDLPQVVEGAKRLLAYNVEADKLIPTFKMLGDIAAGVGKEKLPNLILAFGQVKAATKLTGMELRQFSEAGVPLLQALVDQANEAGGVLTKVGGVSKETARKMKSLASSIAQAEFDLNYFRQTGGKTEKQLKALEERIKKNKAQLASYGQVGQEVYTRVKVTAKEMIKQISEGNITFEQVETALKKMTEEGGRFYNLMERQSKTFSGVMSNLRDEMVRFSMSVMGMTAEGEIRKGSMFYYLKIGAEEALKAIQSLRPIITKFIDDLLKNKEVIFGVVGALVGLFTLIAIAFLQTVGPALVVAGVFATIGAVVGILAGKIYSLRKDIEYFFNYKVTPTILNAWWDLEDFLQKHQLTLTVVAGILTLLLAPAIAKTSFELGILAFKLGVETISAIIFHIQYYSYLIFMYGVEFVQAIGKAIFSLGLWITEGWNAVAMLMVKIAQLGLATAATLTHIAVMTTATVTTNILTAATWALNLALTVLTSPIFWVIAAIGALIAIGILLYKNWDSLVEQAKNVGNKVVQAFESMANSIKSIFNGLMSSAWNWGRNIIRNMIEGIKAAIRSAGKLAGKLLGEIGISMSDLDHYAGGGWVKETGPAIVHKGEYVLSKDMLAGRQPSILPAITNNYNRPINIQMNPVIHTQVDLDYLAYKLSYMLRNS